MLPDAVTVVKVPAAAVEAPITVPSMGSTKSDQPIPSFSASSDGDSDPYRGLYQGGLVA